MTTRVSCVSENRRVTDRIELRTGKYFWIRSQFGVAEQFRCHRVESALDGFILREEGQAEAEGEGVMERKIFWLTFIVLGLVADMILPLWWGLAATIPIMFISWWVAYRSNWF
jgi:hypothetical protein